MASKVVPSPRRSWVVVALTLCAARVALADGEVAEGAVAEGAVAETPQLPPPGEPIPLSDESFNQLASQTEIMIVNFYANWCRFSQMLKPVYAAAARELAGEGNVRLGSIDCEAADTVQTRQANHISKYPTIKVYRRGVALKSEYRGQRSPQAIAAYVRGLLAEPVLEVNNNEEVEGHIQRHRRAVIGHFGGPEHEHMKNFETVATRLRDDCHFLIYKSSPVAGESGSSIMFKSKIEEATYDGDGNDEQALFDWAREHCSPLVREITFENGEELTEEGLPFLILFYDPANHDPVVEFTKEVKARLSGERGQVNFITADGTKFTHPLRHLGKTKKDLPILALDTFKHMHLFRKFKNIHKGDKLEQFIRDLHSGKLHQQFHHPQQQEDDDDAAPSDNKADDPEVQKEVKKEKTLSEKVEKAEQQKNPDVPAELKKPESQHDDENEEAHVTAEDDPSKPVPVKSVLKHLKPSNNRYSFAHNRDEL